MADDTHSELAALRAHLQRLEAHTARLDARSQRLDDKVTILSVNVMGLSETITHYQAAARHANAQIAEQLAAMEKLAKVNEATTKFLLAPHHPDDVSEEGGGEG